MKRLLILILTIFTLSACSDDYAGIKGESYHHEIIKPELPDSIVNQLQNGDIIIRRGDGPLSFHLSRATGEPYTHCGIIYKGKNGWGVIHTLGSEASDKEIDGVQTTSLKRFVNLTADSALFICRPVFKENIGDSIFNRAKYYLNQRIPFDHRFSLLTPEKFYCTELLYYIFKDVNDNKNVFVIEKKRRSYLLMFSTFFNTRNFKEIYTLKEMYQNRSSNS